MFSWSMTFSYFSGPGYFLNWNCFVWGLGLGPHTLTAGLGMSPQLLPEQRSSQLPLHWWEEKGAFSFLYFLLQGPGWCEGAWVDMGMYMR